MNRIKSAIEGLKTEGLDGIFLIKDSNIRYLSGYTGADAYVILSPNGCALITDSRYTEQAQTECTSEFEVIRWRSPAPGLPETIKALCSKYGIKRLGFEKASVTYDIYEKLTKELSDIELVATSGIVESIRYVKDQSEIENLRKAAQIADEAFTEILNYIKVGVSEKDIERELQYLIKKKGADNLAFPIIIASGKNSSLPHAIPSEKLIESGDFITLDFGAMYKGYRSDMTRTIVMVQPSEKQKEIYNLVYAAQELGLQAVKADVLGSTPDTCARGCITEAGYGTNFAHGLGHGVGLDIHEEPFLSQNCVRILKEGNVVTVEPGVYLPGWGGVRIEDTVLVTKEGIEILTKSSKELIIIGK
jgi:Xaa-Pro aminopeptidase